MSPTPPREAFLLLEDGRLYRGIACTPGTAFGEVVFNTSMTGYQEILTDPSYRRQIVVMTLPHIGNYGTRGSAEESRRPWVEGFVARRFTRRTAAWGSEEGLPEYLARHSLPAVEGIDTRALVRHLREHGAMRGVISSEIERLDELAEELAASPSMAGRALVQEVTCTEEHTLEPEPGDGETIGTRPRPLHVAVYDFGTKASIPRCLTERGARVTVLPAHTKASRCAELGIDGVVLSNGPGDPEPLTDIVNNVRQLVASGRPLLGICLGHQLLGLALGGRTYKLKFGHHGANQPVQEIATGKVSITSQNHGFAVDPESLPATCQITHKNLNDGTIEGLELKGRDVFSVQYHPEGAPGPHDAQDLFDQFLRKVEAHLGGT